MAAPSSVLVVSFSAVVLGTLVALFAGLRPAARRLGVSLWPFGWGVALHVLVALGLAGSGVLLSPTLPPRPILLAWGALLGWFVASRTRFGTVVAETPLVFWVGLQIFRLPLELVMHQAAIEGVMPTVMTWTGRNWDILTGLAAPIAAWGLHRGWPRAVAWAFQLFGAGLLLNVVAVAVLASPGPLQRIDTNVPHVWITTPPFVLLPGLLVVLAAISHGIIGWRLWRGAGASASFGAGSRAADTSGVPPAPLPPGRSTGTLVRATRRVNYGQCCFSTPWRSPSTMSTTSPPIRPRGPAGRWSTACFA